MNDDSELLRRFAEEGYQPAFAELVQRKIGLVYAAALRQTSGDAHLAQDVTQGVFLALASGAGRLQRHVVLAGWLHTTTRYLALRAVRTKQRWHRREREANAMNIEPDGAPMDWRELRPEIDAALQELSAKDRDAILLRFFEGQSLAEVGAAIGLAENSARMRVERALEKLRGQLARRGITSTAAALGIALAQSPAVAVPSTLVASASSAGLAASLAGGAGALGGAVWIVNLMNSTKLTVGAIGAAMALGLGAWLGATYQSRARSPTAVGGRGDLAALQAENRQLREAMAARAQANRAASIGASAGAASQAVSTPAAGGATARYPALEVLLDLRRRKLANLEFEFLSEDARLQTAFVELFALTPAEQAKLQDEIDTSRGRLGRLTRENTQLERTAEGGIKLTIKPFPEDGGSIYDGLLKSFSDTLGAERYQAFLALGAEQTEKALGRFGTSRRQITLSKDRSGGEVRYRINDLSQHSPQDNSNYVSDRLTPERFVRELGPLAEVLPADFLPGR